LKRAQEASLIRIEPRVAGLLYATNVVPSFQPISGANQLLRYLGVVKTHQVGQAHVFHRVVPVVPVYEQDCPVRHGVQDNKNPGVW
jgi:hypothetical protein